MNPYCAECMNHILIDRDNYCIKKPIINCLITYKIPKCDMRRKFRAKEDPQERKVKTQGDTPKLTLKV